MTPRKPTTWWIHGSAPGGEAFFDAALAVADVTITCNAGIVEFLCHCRRRLRPDFYWLQDGAAIDLFGRYARVAQELGTVVLSADHIQHPTMRADRPVRLCRPWSDPPRYVRDVMQHVTLSGLLCLQWVANQVATGDVSGDTSGGGDTIIMTGMTGYCSTPDRVVPDTFDGRMGKAGGLDHTTQRIAPFTQSVVAALPRVQFAFCGKPHRVFGSKYRLFSNVAVCATADDLTRCFEECSNAV